MKICYRQQRPCEIITSNITIIIIIPIIIVIVIIIVIIIIIIIIIIIFEKRKIRIFLETQALNGHNSVIQS